MPDHLNLTAAICTMGCKVNTYESAKMAEALQKAGWTIVDFRDRAAVYIINTCTVTQKAEQKARRIIRLLLKKYPNACVLVTGCYAQLAPEEI